MSEYSIELHISLALRVRSKHNLIRPADFKRAPNKNFRLFQTKRNKMPVHHLMVGTWTPPGAIFTFAFDDEALTLKLVKRTEIPSDEPISWTTFSVSVLSSSIERFSS